MKFIDHKKAFFEIQMLFVETKKIELHSTDMLPSRTAMDYSGRVDSLYNAF